MAQTHLSDSVHWYISEVTSRIVAKSGIPTDRFHIGKIILQNFREDPDYVAQIDGGTGESETYGSLLKRSIKCAISFRKLGLKQGDVLVLMAPNHLDLAVPFYAAMYLGIIVAPVDRTLKVGELQYTFKLYKPSIVMCQSTKVTDIEAALNAENLKAKIFTFDSRNQGPSFADLLKVDDDITDFKAAEFNAEDSIGFILPTSGSTGFPKGAAATYKSWMIAGPHIWVRYVKFPTPTSSWMILSPLQWLTAFLHFIMSPVMKITRLQTSKPVTEEHTRYLINTYRPTSTVMSSTMMTQFLKPDNEKLCDLTCFEVLMVGGSVVHKKILQDIKLVSPNTTVVNAFGMTEMCTIGFQGECLVGSCGKPTGIYQYRLVNITTQEDVTEPYVSGELWLKGPGMFKEYYNNPEATKEAFSSDRWFKTGDLFTRDENWNFFFVERIKLLLKYKHYQISPAEIEGVICEHPGVLDVAVAGIPDPECGDLPVACIIPKQGFRLNAQEIKDIVKEKLSDAKQLRGGVIFMSSFPLTTSTKVDRWKLADMVREMKAE